MSRRWLAAGGALVVVGGVVAAIWTTTTDYHEPMAEQADTPRPAASNIRSVLVGGGGTPESNEVSIEEDLLLAVRLLPGPRRVLYANGADTRAVRVSSDEPPTDPLRAQLGVIFNPRSGRSSTYRATRLPSAAPATPGNLLATLAEASQNGNEPLTVWVAGHGGPGETAAQNSYAMWGNRSLLASEVAGHFEQTPPTRELRWVMTTCFSGGFAEIAFDANGAPLKGSDEPAICGLFASTFDREAGGCDPDPERGQHDGYGVHMLNALDGRDRNGETLDPDALDFDEDGAVSLLDAHTWAVLSSGSIDVPTTTSEWYLRNVVARDSAAEPTPGLLPHDDAVVRSLGPKLELGDEAAAQNAVEALQNDIERARLAEEEAVQVETDAYQTLAADLLARWPVLDDPWHPEWTATFERERNAIEEFLAGAPATKKLEAAMSQTDGAAAKRAALEVELAPRLRLARAHENRRLAAHLKATDATLWEQFRAFRSCELGAP